MGANIGTTITAHILSLADISSSNFFLLLIKPSTLAPVAAIIGILLMMTAKSSKHREIGQILVGFGVLFTGMFGMEDAVRPLRDHPAFAEMFATFSNPVIGVAVGALVTAAIQSSSASVGILQALSTTGQITYASAFPIIMGQNIGTCISPILASIGASKSAKRSAVVHLSFNIIGTILFLSATYAIHAAIDFPFWNDAIDRGGIANFHTIFNVVVTLSFMPFVNQLEKLAHFIIKDEAEDSENFDVTAALDDRFFVSPGLALEHSRKAVDKMGELASQNFQSARKLLFKFDKKAFDAAMDVEDAIDKLEDRLNVYLLDLSKKELSEEESREVSLLFHIMSEYERIGDYTTNILEEAEAISDKALSFSQGGMAEMNVLTDAVTEIIEKARVAFSDNDVNSTWIIEPLEEVIDRIEETLKERHINRLKAGKCSVDAAFPYIETLSNLERIADHCSNIGLYLATYSDSNKNSKINMHEYLKELRNDHIEEFEKSLAVYEEKYYAQVAE